MNVGREILNITLNSSTMHFSNYKYFFTIFLRNRNSNSIMTVKENEIFIRSQVEVMNMISFLESTQILNSNSSHGMNIHVKKT